MAYFTDDFNQFFIELAANNHKAWFDANRKRYQTQVKAPFDAFVGILIEEMRKDIPALDVQPKDAVFRINRDIRFSNDKRPYKLNRSAHISPSGRKETGRPGLYVELGPERVYFASGAYFPDKDQLMAIRTAIAEDPNGFEKAMSDPTFVKMFGEIKGEENKRLPNAELTAAAKKHPILLKKQFYYHKEMSPDLVTNDKLVDKIMACYHAAQPVSQFLDRAIAQKD